jgi:hypothetical protein
MTILYFSQYLILIIVVNICIFGGMKRKAEKKMTYDEKLAKCEEFLKTFEDYDLG